MLTLDMHRVACFSPEEAITRRSFYQYAANTDPVETEMDMEPKVPFAQTCIPARCSLATFERAEDGT
jgi:hypothetical protein